VIVIGGKPGDYPMYASLKQAGYIDDPYAMPYETNQPIYVLRGSKPPLDRIWPKLKHYD